MIHMLGILLTILLYPISVNTQCCARFLQGKCLQCPPGLHLYKNNCIIDIDHCQAYINGLECLECIPGYQIDVTSGSCIIIDLRDGEIPINGFIEIAGSEYKSELLQKLIRHTVQLNKNEFQEIELIRAYNRKTPFQSYRKFYRMIFVTEKGLLQTLLGSNDNFATITTEANIIFNKKPEQKFIQKEDPEMLKLIKGIEKTYTLQNRLGSLTFLDYFFTEETNQEFNVLQKAYRLFFVDGNKGIIEISIIIESDSPVATVSQKELDVNSLNMSLKFAISQAQMRVAQPATLVHLSEITTTNNDISTVTYNASFYEQQIRCKWIIFQIANNGSINFLNEGKCIFEILPTLPSCSIESIDLPRNLVFTKMLNFDDFLMSEVFSEIRQYIIECEEFLFEILSLALAQNQTTTFYEIRFQLFNRQQQILFLTAFKNAGQSIRISSKNRIPKSQIIAEQLIIDTKSLQNSTETLLFQDSQTQAAFSFIKVESPETIDYILTKIEKYEFSRFTNKTIFDFTLTMKNDNKYENRSFLEMRVELKNGLFKMLPTIQIQQENYLEIPLQNLEMFGFSIIEVVTKSRIADDYKIDKSQVSLTKFLKSQERQQLYLLYYEVISQLNVYKFESSGGQLSLVQRIHTSQYDLTPLQILQLYECKQIIDFIELIFVDEIKQKQLKLEGVKKMRNESIVNLKTSNPAVKYLYFLVVYGSGDNFMNFTICKQENTKNFRIINVEKTKEFINRYSYTQINTNQFFSTNPQAASKYQLFYNILDEKKTKQIIEEVYQNQTHLIIFDRLGRQTIISKSHQFPVMRTHYKTIEPESKLIFDEEIQALLERYKLGQINSQSLVYVEQLSNKINITRYTFKLILSNNETYELTFELAENQKKIKPLSLRNTLILKKSFTNEQFTLSDEQQQFLWEYFNKRTAQVLRIHKSKNVYRFLIRNSGQGLLQVHIRHLKENTVLLGMRNIGGGYQKIGKDFISFFREKKLFSINSDLVNYDFMNILQKNNQPVLEEIMDYKLILWKIKTYQSNLMKIQVVYELTQYSVAVKFEYLASPFEQNTTLLTFQTFPNHIQALHEKQSKLIGLQTQEVKTDPLFKKIQESLHKTYWYYLRGSSLVSAFKQPIQGGVLFVVSYSTIIRPVQITIQYSYEQEATHIISLTPSMYNIDHDDQIYRCFRYSSTENTCATCHFAYILSTEGQCFPEINNCWVQSGDYCVYGQENLE